MSTTSFIAAPETPSNIEAVRLANIETCQRLVTHRNEDAARSFLGAVADWRADAELRRATGQAPAVRPTAKRKWSLVLTETGWPEIIDSAEPVCEWPQDPPAVQAPTVAKLGEWLDGTMYGLGTGDNAPEGTEITRGLSRFVKRVKAVGGWRQAYYEQVA